jgi:pilus assembly protein CpaF
MGRFRKKERVLEPERKPVAEAPAPNGKAASNGRAARRAVEMQAAQEEERVLRQNDPLLTDLELPPPGQEIPPQRGFISEERAALIKLQLQLADMIRLKVLAPDLSRNWAMERTPDREAAALKGIDGLMEGGRIEIPAGVDKERFVDATMNEIFGYGPLQPFVDDDSVTEIMANGPFIIYIERDGRIIESGHKFLDDDHVERIIRRIVLPLGRMADSEHALIDARLPDGSRVNAVLRPVALDGPSISIRKFSKEKLTIEKLIDFGALTPDMEQFLEALVVSRQNVIVSGGTGSGKTTLINCLSDFIPEHERTVTIEDAAELQLKQRNVVRLETKKPTPEAPNEITVRDCVRNALRMRPERILVGECRGGEALDMLQAMNTGHDGSMTTVHANDPRACISRLETLVLMAGVEMPVDVVRKQVADSVGFIVQVARLRDGTRKVTHITEIEGMEGQVVVMSDIFRFMDEGDRADGSVRGHHASMGVRPKCEASFKQFGFELPSSMFLKARR